MHEHDAGYRHEFVCERLRAVADLLGRDDLPSKQKVRRIFDSITHAYHGRHHAEIHRTLMDYVPDGHCEVVANLLCSLAVCCRDSLELTIRMIARFMRISEWDGTGSIDDVPKLAQPCFSHVYSGLCHSLMDAGRTPREVLDELAGILAGHDRDLILASLLYIASWLWGCREDASLVDFFPDLEERFKDADSVIHGDVTLIRDLVAELEEERQSYSH